MMKSTNFIMQNYPIIMNIMIILIMSFPYKASPSLHPIILIFLLVALTTLISIKMNYLYKSWLSFILFLIMVGGLMIIFMYITSLINNNHTMNNLLMIKNYLIKILLMMILILIIFNYSKLLNLNIQDTWSFNYNLMEEKNEMITSEIYNHNKFTTLFIMMYLFYSMICFMNICYKMNCPLRQLNNYE